jgi:hypothetical protein
MVIRLHSGARPGKDTRVSLDSFQPTQTRNSDYALGNTTSD